jgi:antitoxin (DNA-binding transcriptional repressor) of toxin-antitoxin stability system
MGDKVIIAKVGNPIVKLAPVDRLAKRVFGSAKNDVIFKKGWDAPMTKREIEEFLGG